MGDVRSRTGLRNSDRVFRAGQRVGACAIDADLAPERSNQRRLMLEAGAIDGADHVMEANECAHRVNQRNAAKSRATARRQGLRSQD